MTTIEHIESALKDLDADGPPLCAAYLSHCLDLLKRSKTARPRGATITVADLNREMTR